MPSAYFPTLMLIDTALIYHDGLEITPPYPINLPVVFVRKTEMVSELDLELELKTEREVHHNTAREKTQTTEIQSDVTFSVGVGTVRTLPVGATLTILLNRQVEEKPLYVLTQINDGITEVAYMVFNYAMMPPAIIFRQLLRIKVAIADMG